MADLPHDVGESVQVVRQSRSRTWSIAGALYGVLSMLPLAYGHVYFQVLGYPLARALRWTLPAWYAIQAVYRLPVRARYWPTWAQVTVYAAMSVAFGVVAAMVAMTLARRVRRQLAPE